MVIISYLLLVFLIVYTPVYGYISYQRLKKDVQTKPGTRVKYYYRILLEVWIPTLIIIVLTGVSSLTLYDIGIRKIAIENQWVSYLAFALFTLHLVSLIYHSYKMKYNAKYKEKICASGQFAHIKEMLPVTLKEQKIWNIVSISAGISEEILYRGFLLFFLEYVFPSFSVWIVLIFSAIIFGLGHTYQGLSGVIKTSLIGLYFGFLYLGFGSILPIMLLHTFVDYISKDVQPINLSRSL